MGLDVSHDCWHGAYSAFMRWRREIARAAGFPPLLMMKGFYTWERITPEDIDSVLNVIGYLDLEHRWARSLLQALDKNDNLPIKWESLRPSPLIALLDHSDCGGSLPFNQCAEIAAALEELLPRLPEGDGGGHIGNWREKTQKFIDGLRLAAESKEDVEFR